MNNWREEMLKTVELRDESTLKRVILRMGYDWIDFAYDETKKIGNIFIQSSYGDWNNGWSSMGDDTTLPEFFLEADKYYLANKLWDHNQSDKEFDAGDANDELRKRIIRDRRQGSLDKEDARKFYNLIDELDNETNGPDLWLREYYDVGLGEYDEDIWDHFPGFSPSPKYLSLQDLIIPAIKKYFSGELSKKKLDLSTPL